MSVALRVIPCLDVSGGRVVKGVHFQNLADAGDPVELARVYGIEGADELTFLDVSASVEDRGTMMDVVTKTAEQVFIPLTVGGGIRSVEDVARLLQAGADKISVNTAAITRPDLLSEIATQFGSQVLVLSVDARRTETSGVAPSGFEVTTHGGRTSAGLDALAWVREAQDRGVGEILLNSMDHDGTTKGFDLDMTSQVREICSIPLIASGGAGTVEDFINVARIGVDAVLAASVFHFGTLTISQVKEGLREAGIEVR
ncbi:imidazole glycerol phosphate synthase subunit HisF [Flaviflexus massiliensis]|uniref:imidazole glycerol phosphate synthase subunit HisF n=1 Tax=Flaviflexus massiliensis TaxID=1522309 RepID=UPI0006D53259|nr:imidazole glycerol phosphate synthase subunit HisF [Flaviflexus massiliensis]